MGHIFLRAVYNAWFFPVPFLKKKQCYVDYVFHEEQAHDYQAEVILIPRFVMLWQ